MVFVDKKTLQIKLQLIGAPDSVVELMLNTHTL